MTARKCYFDGLRMTARKCYFGGLRMTVRKCYFGGLRMTARKCYFKEQAYLEGKNLRDLSLRLEPTLNK